MNDNDQPQILSTRLYNTLLRATKAQTRAERGDQIPPDAAHLLDPAVIRRAIENGSIYNWRNIGPKSMAHIKRWLDAQPATEPVQPTTLTENKMTSDPTITDIIASLTQCGFIPAPNVFDVQDIQTQVDAVIEKIGEVARLLRRHRQARQDLHPTELAIETADVVVAAVCLFARSAGANAPGFIAAKLAADEVEAFDRGWLHSGLTREQYERTHGDRN